MPRRLRRGLRRSLRLVGAPDRDPPVRAGHPACGRATASYDLVSWVEDRLGLLASVPMLIAWGMRDFVFDHTSSTNGPAASHTPRCTASPRRATMFSRMSRRASSLSFSRSWRPAPRRCNHDEPQIGNS